MKKLLVTVVASLCSISVEASELKMLEPRSISNTPTDAPALDNKKQTEVKYKYRGQSVNDKPKQRGPMDILASLDQTQNQDRCATINNAEIGGALDLYQVIDKAMCNDPTVREYWLQLKQYEIAKKDSYAGYYPQVSISSGYSRGTQSYRYPTDVVDVVTEGQKNSLTNQIELNWLLYDFGKREANVRKTKVEYLANKMLVRAELQDVLLKTAQKYFNVLAAKSYLKAAKSNESSAYQNYEISNAKRSGGIGVLSDELQAKNSYISYQYSRARSEAELKNAMGELANTIGYPITQTIKLKDIELEVPDKFSMENVDVLMDKALVQHPKLLAAKQQIIASQENLSSTRSGMLPTIYFSASGSLEDLSNRKNTTTPSSASGTSGVYSYDQLRGSNVGINIRIPLFSGFNQYNQVLNAKNSLDLIKTRYQTQEKEIMLYVWKAYQNLSSATEKVKIAKNLLTNARQAQSLASGRYQSGVGSILELLNTQGNLSQAEVYNVEAAVEWHISRLSLIAGLGQLDLAAVADKSLLAK